MDILVHLLWSSSYCNKGTLLCVHMFPMGHINIFYSNSCRRTNMVSCEMLPNIGRHMLLDILHTNIEQHWLDYKVKHNLWLGLFIDYMMERNWFFEHITFNSKWTFSSHLKYFGWHISFSWEKMDTTKLYLTFVNKIY